MTLGVEHLFVFNLALLAAMISPGPALLYAMREALSGGARAGLAAAAGLAACATLWTTAALFGLTAVFAAFPWLYGSLKLVGAAYLVLIALRVWRNADAVIGEAPQASQGRRALRAFAVNLGNPKSALFAAALLVVIFPPTLTIADKAAIALNQFAIEGAFYAAVAFAMSRRAVAERYMRAKRLLDRAAALVMGGLGLRLAASN